MKFYIVTPTYNALEWLRCCVRSVADQVQDGVEVHHHVQDGASTDGTAEWLALWQREHQVQGYTFTYESAKDGGMYAAINLAWEKMPTDADVTAHLNSDEQYLPGALAGVAAGFAMKPEADIALGTYIIVDNAGRYICHRRPILPHVWTSLTVCEIITCSCFHKADTFRKHGIRFDTRWRAIADVVFYRDIVRAHPRFLLLPNLITGTFAVTGQNLAWSETSRREWQQVLNELPCFAALWHQLTYRWCNFRRRIRDLFCSKPLSYVYYRGDNEQAAKIKIRKPTCCWGRRTRGEEPL